MLGDRIVVNPVPARLDRRRKTRASDGNRRGVGCAMIGPNFQVESRRPGANSSAFALPTCPDHHTYTVQHASTADGTRGHDVRVPSSALSPRAFGARPPPRPDVQTRTAGERTRKALGLSTREGGPSLISTCVRHGGTLFPSHPAPPRIVWIEQFGRTRRDLRGAVSQRRRT